MFRVVSDAAAPAWCGSGSMLRSWRSMKCAVRETEADGSVSTRPVPGAADVGRVVRVDAAAGRVAGGGGGGGADVDDLAGVVGGAGGRRWCGLSLLGARHAARLRGAISGKHKCDVIDADVLARAGEVFDLHPLRPVDRRSWRCVGRVCAAGRR